MKITVVAVPIPTHCNVCCITTSCADAATFLPCYKLSQAVVPPIIVLILCIANCVLGEVAICIDQMFCIPC